MSGSSVAANQGKIVLSCFQDEYIFYYVRCPTCHGFTHELLNWAGLTWYRLNSQRQITGSQLKEFSPKAHHAKFKKTKSMLFALVLLCTTLVYVNFGNPVREIGKLATYVIYVATAGLIFVGINKQIVLRKLKILSPIMFSAGILSILFLLRINFDPFMSSSVNSSLGVLLLFSFLILIALGHWDLSSLRPFCVVLTMYVLFIFCWAAQAGFPKRFSAYALNENSLGSFLFGVLFLFGLWFIEEKKYWRIICGAAILMSSVLIFLTDSRKLLLGSLCGVAVYFLWPLFFRKRLIRIVGFLVFIFGIILFVYLYVYFSESSYSATIEDFVFTVTGGRFYNRVDLWENALEVIGAKPFFGYGTGKTLSNLGQDFYSAHNLYLGVTIRVGIVGVFFLFLFFGKLWGFLEKFSNDKVVRFAACELLAIMLVSLFGNIIIIGNTPCTLIVFIGLGIGMSHVIAWKRHDMVFRNVKRKLNERK